MRGQPPPLQARASARPVPGLEQGLLVVWAVQSLFGQKCVRGEWSDLRKAWARRIVLAVIMFHKALNRYEIVYLCAALGSTGSTALAGG